MITFEQVQEEFPEARLSNSSGHDEYYVHCRNFHKKGGIYKMSINAETGVYYCHDCGATGNAIFEFFDDTAAFHKKQIIREDRKADKVRVKIRAPEWEDGTPSPGELVPVESLEEDHPASVYLRKRGIDKITAKMFDLQYCVSGHFHFCEKMGTTSGRIIFPIRMGGKLIGWQARQVDASTKSGRRAVWHGEKKEWWYPIKESTERWSDHIVPKYYTCPGMPRYKALFNFDNAIDSGRDTVVITEGPIDAIKVGQKGVATLGSKISVQQQRIIKANWNQIIWILDQDIDTDSEWFIKTLERFEDGNNVTYMKLQQSSDPGSCTQQEIWKEILTNKQI